MGGYAINAWLHLVAATVWIGGMLFISLVVVPAGRSMPSPETRALLVREVGRRFRLVAWPAIAVLVVTGAYAAWRGGHLTALANGDLLAYGAGRFLAAKVALVGAMILLSAVHDFVLGPRASALAEAARSGPGRDPAAERRVLRARRITTWVARLNVALALVVALAGVRVVRG